MSTCRGRSAPEYMSRDRREFGLVLAQRDAARARRAPSASQRCPANSAEQKIGGSHSRLPSDPEQLQASFPGVRPRDERVQGLSISDRLGLQKDGDDARPRSATTLHTILESADMFERARALDGKES